MSDMSPSAEERMDRAHLDHGQWLAKDVDKVLTLIREAFSDGLARKDAEIKEVVLALEAHTAWSWSEANHKEATFDERMELCKYAEWLTARALAIASGDPTGDEYEGVPHMVIWPSVFISRIGQDEAREIVKRLMDAWRQAIRARGEGR